MLDTTLYTSLQYQDFNDSAKIFYSNFRAENRVLLNVFFTEMDYQTIEEELAYGVG